MYQFIDLLNAHSFYIVVSHLYILETFFSTVMFLVIVECIWLYMFMYLFPNQV